MTKIGAPIRNLSRAEAKAQGLKRYFDGVECPNGHLSDKLVSNYTCIQCLHKKHQANRKPKRAAVQAEKAEKAEIQRLYLLSKAPFESANTKREAFVRGLTIYFTGKPCKYGHVSGRNLNNACIGCIAYKSDLKSAARAQKPKSVKVKLAAPPKPRRKRQSQRAAITTTTTADEARSLGMRRYFTGIPCERGHIARRRLYDGSCVACIKSVVLGKEGRRTYNAKRANNLRAKDPEKARSKTRTKYNNDTQVKLRSVLRCRIKHALKGHTKNPTSALIYLGCTVAEARAHIEKLFLPGMTWENHSHRGWHIDHIIPIASFDMSDEEQRKQAFNYLNLQPLWARHNQIKSGRLLTANQLAQLI